MGIFNKDHYPTPHDVILKMCEGLVLHNKHVLEPSIGSGRIVDFLQDQGANVIGCEIDEQLRLIAESKCRIIENDFMHVKSDQVSHVNYIIMNPPFSADEKHILHAWDIAPDGCEIIALCNVETLRNSYSSKRKELSSIIKEYGKWDNLKSVFIDAERTTRAEIAMVKLSKPSNGNTGFEDEFEGFCLNDEEEEQFIGLQQYNWVRDIVNRYIGSVKIFRRQMDLAIEMNNVNKGFFGKGIKISHSFEASETTLNIETYKKELQKEAWKYAIAKFNLEKFVTKSVKDDINKFVETQTQIPFTMRNVYKMIEILIGTSANRMDKAITDVFDALTKHYDENRFDVEGFKTNSNYLVNEKFILPHIFYDSYSWHTELSVTYDNRNAETFEDFVKALCFINGINYDMMPSLYEYLRHSYSVKYPDGRFLMVKNPHHEGKFNMVGITNSSPTDEDIQRLKDEYEPQGLVVVKRPDYGKWFDFGFFEIKGFKKGTGHMKFKDRDVWARFNQQVARIKGFPLPDIRDFGSEKRSQKARKEKMKKAS